MVQNMARELLHGVMRAPLSVPPSLSLTQTERLLHGVMRSRLSLSLFQTEGNTAARSDACASLSRAAPPVPRPHLVPDRAGKKHDEPPGERLDVDRALPRVHAGQARRVRGPGGPRQRPDTELPAVPGLPARREVESAGEPPPAGEHRPRLLVDVADVTVAVRGEARELELRGPRELHHLGAQPRAQPQRRGCRVAMLLRRGSTCDAFGVFGTALQ